MVCVGDARLERQALDILPFAYLHAFVQQQLLAATVPVCSIQMVAPCLHAQTHVHQVFRCEYERVEHDLHHMHTSCSPGYPCQSLRCAVPPS